MSIHNDTWDDEDEKRWAKILDRARRHQIMEDKDFIKNLEQRLEAVRAAEAGRCTTCGAVKLEGCNGKVQTITSSGFATKHVVCPNYKEALYMPPDESSVSGDGESGEAQKDTIGAPPAAETTNGTVHQ